MEDAFHKPSSTPPAAVPAMIRDDMKTHVSVAPRYQRTLAGWDLFVLYLAIGQYEAKEVTAFEGFLASYRALSVLGSGEHC